MDPNTTQPLVPQALARWSAAVALALAGLTIVGVALAQDSSDPCIGPDGLPIVGDEDCPGNGGGNRPLACPKSSDCFDNVKFCSLVKKTVGWCCPVEGIAGELECVCAPPDESPRAGCQLV